MKKLRIGLLLDSCEVPGWEYHAIQQIAQSDFIEIVLIIVNDCLSKPLVKKRKKSAGPSIYSLYHRLDQKLFISGPNADERKHLEDFLGNIPVLKTRPIHDGAFVTLIDDDIQLVRDADLDILVRFGFKNLKGRILSSVKYGIWAYRFGMQTPVDWQSAGYGEVMAGEPVTGAVLYSQGADFPCGRILYRSQLATYPFSAARNRNGIGWFASAFMLRQMRLLYTMGEERFFQEISRFGPPIDLADYTETKSPSGWDVLKAAVRLPVRILRELAFRLLYRDSWDLFYGFHDGPSLNIRGFRKLSPPADRFWADPFIVRRDRTHYIFVEEFLYQKRKGHIAVIEVDEGGRIKESIPVLSKDYHLSYPCIFQHRDTYYMIPESASHKSIDLYECQEFPTKWVYKTTLMQGVNAVDTTMLQYEGKWWLFTGMRESTGGYRDVELFLFYADDLFAKEWKSHPLNPIVSNVTNARPAGRIFQQNGKLWRPSQDCTCIYGHHINLNEIRCLSETDYVEETRTVIRPDWDARILASHTFGTFGQLTVIDAFTRKPKIRLVEQRQSMQRELAI